MKKVRDKIVDDFDPRESMGRPHAMLVELILSRTRPKTEIEWAARTEILSLRDEIDFYERILLDPKDGINERGNIQITDKRFWEVLPIKTIKNLAKEWTK
jgi:hypothetical protein